MTPQYSTLNPDMTGGVTAVTIPHIEVVCAVIEREERVLAARRAPGSARGGLWEFPGGKPRPGESAEKALIRELREELDVEICIEAPMKPIVHAYPDLSLTLISFVCGIRRGNPRPLEHDRLKWVSIEEAIELQWAGADIPVLKMYAEIKGKRLSV